MDDRTAVLRGGTRDGETTPVGEGVRRLVAPSGAPGLVDVYEATGRPVDVRGGGHEGEIFDFVGQEPADDLAPQAQNMPPTPPG